MKDIRLETIGTVYIVVLAHRSFNYIDNIKR